MLLENTPACGLNVIANHLQKPLWLQRGGICGRKHDPAGFQDWKCCPDQCFIIFVRPKHAVFLGLREGRRIQKHHIESPFLFRQPPQPLKGIAKDKIVPGRIQPVERKIAFAPFQIFFPKGPD